MLDLLWLLLPVAAATGWYTAKWSEEKSPNNDIPNIPNEYVQGINFLVNEQPDKALEVFIRFVEVDSDTIETHVVLGNLFRQRGEVDRAIRIHQNLIARPNLDKIHRATALLELGRDYLKAGLLGRAEGLFKEVIAIGIQKKEAHQHLKELYEQERDWEKAIDNAVSLQKSMPLKQNGVIAHYYCELGGQAKQNQQLKIAEKMAKKALSYDRKCVRASILLGDLCVEKADYQTAIKYYSNVFTQNLQYLSFVLPLLKRAHEENDDLIGYQGYLQKIHNDHHELSSILGLIESYRERGDVQNLRVLLKEELEKQDVPLSLLRKYIQYVIDNDGYGHPEVFDCIANALDHHLDAQISHQCVRCGFEVRGVLWQCPSCHGWGTIQPRIENKATALADKHYSV